MPEKRFALVIATDQYSDKKLSQLHAPLKDGEALSRVLADPVIGGYEVKTLFNVPSDKLNMELEAFFSDRKPGDLLLLYFSCHGIKDDDGLLYFAAVNTQDKLKRSTAVSASYVNELMTKCRAQQVLLLDCCFSGAFSRTGLAAKGEEKIGTGERFGGRGRVVLTASDALQFAHEAEKAQGGGKESLFTRFLVEGLSSGKADKDGDGCITPDEIYEYVHDRVIDETPGQRPGIWAYGVQGKLEVARNPRASSPQARRIWRSGPRTAANPKSPPRRRTWLLPAGLVGAALLGGAFVWFRPHRSSPPDIPALIVDIDAALSAKHWGDALEKAEQVLRYPGLPASYQTVAVAKKEQAEAERAAQERYDHLTLARDRNAYDEVVSLYRQIPAASVYGQPATKIFAQVLPAFTTEHLNLAEKARKRGDCAEFQTQVDRVLEADRSSEAAQALKNGQCGPGKVAATSEVKKQHRHGSRHHQAPPRTMAGLQAAPVGECICSAIRDHYVSRNYREAIEAGRRCVSVCPDQAWRYIGAAACNVRNDALLRSALRQLHGSDRDFVVRMCVNTGMVKE